MAEDKRTESFSVTLPVQAVKLLEALAPEGLYGTTRAEVARQLILDQLKQLRAQGILK